MTNSNNTQTLLDAVIVKESAKAYLVQVTVDSSLGHKGWNLWFPKSRSNWDGRKFAAESWLIEAKSADLPEWAWDIMTESDVPQDLKVESEVKSEEKKETSTYKGYGSDMESRIQAILKSQKEKREAALEKIAPIT